MNFGRRYGLIGQNGCGKSTFLQCLAAREVPIPEHMDIYLLAEEAPPTELSALNWVLDAAHAEIARLEALAETIIEKEGAESETVLDVYESLDALDPSTFESRASRILIGLGFDAKTIHKKTEDMSGGWRMRVALSRALFIQPTMLLLDEPTNHLDLEACVWLEEYLSSYSKILVVVSHSQDFLNGVCTNIIVMQQRQMKYWGGNYDTYQRTREEQDVNQVKLYKKQQAEIQHTKQFIASCGTFSNLVRQAKSRQKQLDKMEEAGLLTMPYSKKEDYLFSGLHFGIDSDSRIALVGPNGAGKSTLLKLMVGQLQPVEGNVSRRSGLSIGRYHQHSAEVLDLAKSPVDYLKDKFCDKFPELKFEQWRSKVGSFGVTGDAQLNPIENLSDGLRTRLVFAEIALMRPHILLLDEPTNHASMEMIDSMARAIKQFQGGVIVISHDFRLLQQVAEEIWVVDEGRVAPWGGDILTYKTSLKKKKKTLA
ncbi:flagellar associated protein [Ectocarpus siliculosus]|uniref:Flagellar associated protein n=1 Tax=Ectocarpus siliculosus TaxID=2880 RepID=D8LIR7_ECTSI|nr:flagellar associated protein [Ectocarpus siliculosus]|eukprot:CBN79440.1 flagellar associated protein [Ectocarpus siliculosus]